MKNSEEDYLLIQKFADLAGVTTQSIYKRIKKPNNPIHSFLKETEEGLKLHRSALDLLYSKKAKGTTTQPRLEVHKPLLEKTEEKENKKQVYEIETTASGKVIDILKEQLEAQKIQIQEKDKQIAELNERLAESQRMLDQQQKLSMADKKQILMLEEKAGATKSRGLFSRLTDLFKGKESINNE